MTSTKSNGTTNITIHRVAELAGVSTATVSRVINGSEGVSDELKEKVKKIIQQTGYRPNRAARLLRAGKVRKVGVLFADIRNPFFTSVLAGIEGALQRADYVLILGNTNDDAKVEQMHLQAFMEEGVSGIIFASQALTVSQYQSFLEFGIPMLLIDRVPEGLKVDSVSIDNFESARRATHHLLTLGHKNIAYIGGPERISTARLRREGFQKACGEGGIDSQSIFLGNFRQDGGYQAMEQCLTASKKSTAVLVGNNLMTLGALEAIHKHNLSIPNEIALVGFDDMPWATSLQPPLTVIAQPTYELGSIAARLLLDRIQNPENPIQQVFLATQLIVRKSCGGPIKAGNGVDSEN